MRKLTSSCDMNLEQVVGSLSFLFGEGCWLKFVDVVVIRNVFT